MTINKFNYESYALDYLEGHLSVEMTEEMERFLKTHPAIEAELSGMMELMVLEPDLSIVYDQKESLLKEEKVVWLSRKWVRPLVAAASVLLLLTTFYLGYQAGVNQGGVVVVDSGSSGGSSSSSSSSSPELVVLEENEELVSVEKVPEKVEETIVKIISKMETVTPLVKQPKKVVAQEERLQEIVTEKINEPLQLIENERIVKLEIEQGKALPFKKIADILAPLPTKNTPLLSNYSTEIGLEKALHMDSLIDEKTLANYQKRKRSFKDLLGRFPVSNLKEALIPTYYKEETAGQ